MVKKTSNWIEDNKTVIGWLFAALIYGAMLYGAIQQEIKANNKDAQDSKTDIKVQQEINLQQEKRLDNYEATVEKMNTAIQRIDNNVVEIKTDLKHKKDK